MSTAARVNTNPPLTSRLRNCSSPVAQPNVIHDRARDQKPEAEVKPELGTPRSHRRYGDRLPTSLSEDEGRIEPDGTDDEENAGPRKPVGPSVRLRHRNSGERRDTNSITDSVRSRHTGSERHPQSTVRTTDEYLRAVTVSICVLPIWGGRVGVSATTLPCWILSGYPRPIWSGIYDRTGREFRILIGERMR